ncbi:MAG: tetratricopeptide repeat protein [Nitrospinae bacterium]|nr:tetratricopeptide repeat protein [Nitrospinota bacterium]
MSVIALTFAALISAAPADAAASMAEGDRLYAAFDNRGAMERYHAAHEADPAAFEPHMKYVRTIINTGEDLNSKESGQWYERGLAEAEALAARHPGEALSWQYRALAAGQLAKFRGGGEKVKLSRRIHEDALRAVSMDGSLFVTHIVLGVYYREVANLNWALKLFAKSFFGGLTEGTNEQALAELRKAIALHPASVRAHFELGETYAVMGRRDDSLAAFRKALDSPVEDHRDPWYKEQAAARLADEGR